MTKQENTKVLSGEEAIAALSADDLEKLAVQYAKDVYKAEDADLSAVREGVRALVSENEESSSFGWGDLKKWLPVCVSRRLFSKETGPESRFQFIVELLKDAIEAKTLHILQQDGVTIGMMHFKEMDSGKLPEQYADRTIHEIKAAVILPEARGQGAYTPFREAAIKVHREHIPDGGIVTTSKSSAVKHLSDSWEHIGYAEYLRMSGWNDEQARAGGEQVEATGETAFLDLPPVIQ